MHSKSVGRNARDDFHILIRPEARHTPTICFRQDRNLRYTWIHSPRPGFNSRDVLGRSDRDLLDKEDAICLETLKRRVLKTGVTAREEVRVLEGGVARYYDLTVEPLRNPLGEVTGISGFGFDITDRRRSEAQMAQQLSEQQDQRAQMARALEKAAQGRLEKLARELEKLAGKPPRRAGALEEKLRALGSEVGDLAREVREIASQLDPDGKVAS